MASPLIVKPLAVRGGYLACALWLNRRFPPGEVGLVETNSNPKLLRAGSTAPFDRLIAPGDVSLLDAISPTTPSLRDAFLEWVEGYHSNVWRVA